VLDMTTVIGNGLYGQAIGPIQQVKAIVDAGREPTAAEVAAISAGFFEAGRRLGQLDGLNNLSVGVLRPGEARARTGFGTDPQQFFATIFPGLVVFGLLFIAQALAIRLLRDRTRGLQRRLVMTPVSPWAITGGGVLFMIAGLFVLLLVLGGIGALIFGITLHNPPALLAIGLGVALFATGLHLLSIALAKSDRSASFVGGVVVLLLSLVGGTFVPADQFPPLLRTVALLVPNGAAQQGFIDVLVRQRGLADIAGRLAVTWTWGLVLLAAALLADRRRMRA
jgi:ABC-type multidrug transport system permease subunit